MHRLCPLHIFCHLSLDAALAPTVVESETEVICKGFAVCFGAWPVEEVFTATINIVMPKFWLNAVFYQMKDACNAVLTSTKCDYDIVIIFGIYLENFGSVDFSLGPVCDEIKGRLKHTFPLYSSTGFFRSCRKCNTRYDAAIAHTTKLRSTVMRPFLPKVVVISTIPISSGIAKVMDATTTAADLRVLLFIWV